MRRTLHLTAALILLLLPAFGCSLEALRDRDLEGDDLAAEVSDSAEVGDPIEGGAETLAYDYDDYDAAEYSTAFDRGSWADPSYSVPEDPPDLPTRPEYPEPGYVRYLQGEVYLKGDGDVEWTHADLNLPIQEGDGLWVDAESRAEFELRSGLTLRMAERAKVDVVKLWPDIALRGWTGATVVTVPAAYSGSILFEAPGASITLAAGTEVRVDIAEDGYTRYSVYAGECRVAEPERERIVTANNRFYVEPGSLGSDPEPIDGYDDFDEWSRGRNEPYMAPTRTEYRPPATTRYTGAYLPGSAHLDEYGEWVELGSRHYYRPRVPAGWRPYSQGYWSHSQPYGYVWVSYDPFGYATHHYGRWTFHPQYGWIWLPGRVWRPHHCYFASSGTNVMWAPLDPWGRPAYLGRVDFEFSGGMYVDFRAWSFLPRPSFVGGGRHVASVNVNMFNGPVDINVVQTPQAVFKSVLRGRTPFSSGHGGIRIQEQMSRVQTRLASLPAPGFHLRKGVKLVRSPVAKVKLSAPAKVFHVELPRVAGEKHILKPSLPRFSKHGPAPSGGGLKIPGLTRGKSDADPKKGPPTTAGSKAGPKTSPPKTSPKKVEPRKGIRKASPKKAEPRKGPKKASPKKGDTNKAKESKKKEDAGKDKGKGSDHPKDGKKGR